MQGRTSQLDGGQELTAVQRKDFESGNLFSRIIDAVNSVAQNLGAVAVGKLDPPPPVQSIQVQGVQSGNVITCPSEILHWTINHTQEIQKHVHYFSEIATEPNFLAPHVISHGASRTGFLHLPTFLNDGVTKQTFYLRSYVQYPGSGPNKPVVVGGLAGATKIQMTGSSATTLLSSPGSGTASANGTQGGKGLGTVLTRSAPTTKRNIT
jgi:hypothetical protein